MITRRRLLRGGFAAAAALAIAGLVYESWPDRARRDPEYRFTILDDEDRAIVAASAPVMLAGALASDDDIERVVRGTDTAIAGLPLAVRAEVRQLFGILRFPLTRMFVAGIFHPWNSAQPSEVAHFLQSWRYSNFAKLRSAYDALHQLLMAAWYGNSVSWPATGYPGPPSVPR